MEDIAIKSNHNLLKTVPDLLFISLSNYAYVEMTENHLLSLKRNNIDNHIAFVLDEESYEVLSNKGYNVSLYKNINELEYLNFASPKFNNISFFRWHIINKLLENNIKTWYLDIDTVVLHNLNLLLPHTNGAELVIQNDINMLCSGCMLFIPSPNTIQLTKFVIDNKSEQCNDQIFLNNFLRSGKLNIKLQLFSIFKFPNGLLFFNELHSNPVFRNYQKKFLESNEDVLFVHANWMTGKETKIKALKDKNLWYL